VWVKYDSLMLVDLKQPNALVGTLENAFECLRDLAVENGASEGIEMIQIREKDKIILFGLPGTMEKMKKGSFPPPPLRAEEVSSL